MVLSRLIYTMPLLIFFAVNFESFITYRPSLIYFGIWAVLFGFSLFFFALSRKILPFLLIHFIFLSEVYLFTQMAITTNIYTFFLFIILSSFYTIESLRNDSFHMFIHLLLLFGSIVFLSRFYNLSVLDFQMENLTTLLILASPIVCRAIMAAMEARDIVLREVKKPVYIPMEDTNKVNVLKQKVDFFKERTKDLKTRINNVEKEKEDLLEDRAKIKRAYELLYDSNLEKMRINKEIAQAYFYLVANTRFDLSRSLEENLHNTLLSFQKISKSPYVALIVKNINDEESYDLDLADSVNIPGIEFTDEDFLADESVISNIIDSIDKNKTNYQYQENSDIGNLKGIRNIIYTPISLHPDVKGVLVQAHDSAYKSNIHNFNLSLIVAYHIYTALTNENLYRQAKSEANLDGLTGIYNKKYLENNMQKIFNNSYNYGNNLACIFIDVDYFKTVNDTYGHNIGDKLLKSIASILKENIRKSDFLFRYGGDEFVVLLNSANEEKLKQYNIETNAKLKEEKESLGIETDISLSMGAKIFYPLISNVTDAKSLLEQADKILYKVKTREKGNIYIE